MRSCLARSLLVAAALAAQFGLAPTAVAQEEIVMATWGGTTGETFKKDWVVPFEAAIGIKVRMIFGGSASNKQQVAAQKDKPQIDVLTMVSGDALSAYEANLTEALDPREIPNLASISDVAIRRAPDGKVYGASLYFTVLGILYRTDKVTWPMETWADLWDPKLKDKVGVPNPKYANAYFLAMMNKIAGGQPNDIAPGIAKTKTLASNTILEYEAPFPTLDKMVQGEIWAMPILDIAAAKLLAKGDFPARFYVPKEGAPSGVDVIALVKNAPHAAAAKKFINFVLSKNAAGAVCNDLVLTCVNKSWEPDAKIKNRVLTPQEIQRLIAFDDAVVNRDKGKWLEAWIREVTPALSR